MKKNKNNYATMKLFGVIGSCFVTGFLGGFACYLNKENKKMKRSMLTIPKEKLENKKQDLIATGKVQYINIKNIESDLQKDAMDNAKDEVASTK